MNFGPVLVIVILSCICICQCRDLVVGTNYNGQLAWQQTVKYNSLPYKRRTKEEFFADAGQQLIKGIIARDLDNSNSDISITSGGIGYSYVNLRLKSERGRGLNYQLEVYT